MMTDYEKQKSVTVIKTAREQYRNAITQGAVDMFYDAAKNVIGKQAEVDREKSKAVNRYDPGRLAQEMQLAEMRINQAATSDAGRFNMAAVEGIIREAEISGDLHKKRATYEALQNLVGKIPAGELDTHGNDLKFKANHLAKDAGRKLQELNLTDGLIKADAEMQQAVQELNGAKREVFRHMETIGDVMGDVLFNRPVEKVLNAVQQDQTGRFVIVDDDNP